MAEHSLHAGSKRPHADSNAEQASHKKRKVRRRLQHVQDKPQDIEPAPQSAVFVQGQLMRSITAALTMAGFDGVQPTALEMFRSHVEEYMINFLRSTRASMTTSRRTTPTAQDFASALASNPNTSTASLLRSQLKLAIPEGISYPSIPAPDPPPPPAPDFSTLLEPLMAQATPNHIPRHFPRLPPSHAWKNTAVYPERVKDSRKMREKATEEGILAEQALRKLAAAAKKGAIEGEMQKLDKLSGPGRKLVGKGDKKKAARDTGATREEMFGDMLKEAGGEGDKDEQDVINLGQDGMHDLREGGVDVGMPEGVVVNWDTSGWRRGGRKGLRL